MKVPKSDWKTFRFPNVVTPKSVCEMIQACINQPSNLDANMSSLRRRLPTLEGPSQQTKAVLANVKIYSEFLKGDKLELDNDFRSLPDDLKREVRRGLRSLNGAKRAYKGNLKCTDCGQ